MEERHLKLTQAVYRVIEFFPEQEPLKNKIKEKALEILADLILVFLPRHNPIPQADQKQNVSLKVVKDIEILKGYFKLARAEQWLDNLNFLVLSQEYDKIKEKLEENLEKSLLKKESVEKLGKTKETIEASQPKTELKQNNLISDNQAVFSIDKPTDFELSQRQKEILKILTSQEQAQVSDFKKVLTNVSKRTLRRDLDDLLKKKKVIRAGAWNQVVYKIFPEFEHQEG